MNTPNHNNLSAFKAINDLNIEAGLKTRILRNVVSNVSEYIYDYDYDPWVGSKLTLSELLLVSRKKLLTFRNVGTDLVDKMENLLLETYDIDLTIVYKDILIDLQKKITDFFFIKEQIVNTEIYQVYGKYAMITNLTIKTNIVNINMDELRIIKNYALEYGFKFNRIEYGTNGLNLTFKK